MFLDTVDTYEDKLNILGGAAQPYHGLGILNTVAVFLDLELEEGTRIRYMTLKENCIVTLEKI